MSQHICAQTSDMKAQCKDGVFFVCLCDVCCFIYLPWGQRTALDSNAFPGSEGRRQLPVRYAAWGVRAGMWPLFWPVWAYCAHYSGWKNRVVHGSDRCCCTVLKFKKFSHFKSCGLLNRKKTCLVVSGLVRWWKDVCGSVWVLLLICLHKHAKWLLWYAQFPFCRQTNLSFLKAPHWRFQTHQYSIICWKCTS